MMMSMKQFNVKQAQRWLQKLKTQNLQSYKDVTKFLRKYERTDDEYDCYLKISHTLLAHTELTKELNLFLEDGNKFVVTRAEDQKLRDFMSYAKKNRPQMFNRIISMIQELNKSKGEGNTEVSKLIIPKLNEIVKGDPEMEQLTLETFNMNDEQLIRRKNIEHLIVSRISIIPPEENKDNPLSESAVPKERKAPQPIEKVAICPPPEEKRERQDKQPKEIKAPVIGGFTSSGEERGAIRQMEKSIDYKTYRAIAKVVKIYYLNLISKKEVIELLAGAGLEEVHFQNLKDILETRQADRRKNSFFKPLSDINFSSYERASPSYVTVPFFYPIKSSGKTAESSALTNNKWISVPYGSEESQNFSVRNKNTHEINLLKAEDERYQYDLYMKRLQKTVVLLDRYLASAESAEIDGDRLLQKAVDLGIIQLVYKHCREEQKEEFQRFMRNNPEETSRLFRQKLATEIIEMRNIRDVHAIKNWNQIATKNFYKALDLKGFEFKKNQKQRMRNQYLMHELNDRLKFLALGRQIKTSSLNFEEKQDFFKILNSFQCSSRTEKCTSRTLPEFETFDLKDEKNRIFYPAVIMAFQDQTICGHLYSLLLFYIDSSPITETEKYKTKMFLEQFLIGYLKWKPPMRKTLTEAYNQEHFYHKLADPSYDFDCDNCFETHPEPLILKRLLEGETRRGAQQRKSMKIGEDISSKYSYLPRGGQQQSVFYCSQHVYCLTRYIYGIYERLIRVREVAESEEKEKIFQLLFFTSVKVKEGLKFQENLNLLFGTHAYLFVTIYKLFDSSVKSAAMAANCPLTSNSFKFAEQEKCEDLYFLLLNRFCLSSSLINNKLIRLTFHRQSKVLYVNALDSYYKVDDLSKDMIKRRNEISKMVEMETVDDFESGAHKRRRLTEYWQQNGQEYVFGSSSFKMINHGDNSDVLVFKNRHEKGEKSLMRQLKRAFTFHTYTH